METDARLVACRGLEFTSSQGAPGHCPSCSLCSSQLPRRPPCSSKIICKVSSSCVLCPSVCEPRGQSYLAMLLLFFSIIHILSLCYLLSVFSAVCVYTQDVLGGIVPWPDCWFSSSTLMWVPGMEFKSLGSACQHLYSLSHLACTLLCFNCFLKLCMYVRICTCECMPWYMCGGQIATHRR